MEWRKNQGFIIVNQITVGGAEFVLGVHEKNPNSFVLLPKMIFLRCMMILV